MHCCSLTVVQLSPKELPDDAVKPFDDPTNDAELPKLLEVDPNKPDDEESKKPSLKLASDGWYPNPCELLLGFPRPSFSGFFFFSCFFSFFCISFSVTTSLSIDFFALPFMKSFTLASSCFCLLMPLAVSFFSTGLFSTYDRIYKIETN